MMLFYDDVFPTAEHKQEYIIAEAHGETVGYPPSPPPFRTFTFLPALKRGSIVMLSFVTTRSANDHCRPTHATDGINEFNQSDTVPISASTRNGTITVLDLCDASGRPRLFDPLAQPSPLVQIFDLRGRLVTSCMPERLDDVLATLDRGLYLVMRHRGRNVTVDRRYVE